jgi:hypothetical protein
MSVDSGPNTESYSIPWPQLLFCHDPTGMIFEGDTNTDEDEAEEVETIRPCSEVV